jgi:hypothetical protein
MEEEEEFEDCSIPEIQSYRWYIVVVVGTTLSVISLISNILIARVLLKRKHSNFYFLGLLAVSDCFISFCFFPVVASDIVRFSIGVSFLQTGCLKSNYSPFELRELRELRELKGFTLVD